VSAALPFRLTVEWRGIPVIAVRADDLHARRTVRVVIGQVKLIPLRRNVKGKRASRARFGRHTEHNHFYYVNFSNIDTILQKTG
jgi:hypothetical protein